MVRQLTRSKRFATLLGIVAFLGLSIQPAKAASATPTPKPSPTHSTLKKVSTPSKKALPSAKASTAKKATASKSATKSTPKPQSTKKATTKKATAKRTAVKKSTVAKSVAKKSSTKTSSAKKSTTKVTPRRVITKQTLIRRANPVRSITPLASPSPSWPPANFLASNGIYLRVPSGPELISILSAQDSASSQVQRCTTNACGAVQVASAKACTWWEIDSTVFGPGTTNPGETIVLGNLRTLAQGTKPKQQSIILLISSEPLATGVELGDITASCYTDPPVEDVPSNLYKANQTR